MSHLAGTGPAYATACVFELGTTDRVHVYSDVGLTQEIENPFALNGVTYDVYTAEDAYVVFGLSAIYEEVPSLSKREYMAPQSWPRQEYAISNVTFLRAGDFSTLVAADVRSILGTLIRDLKDLGILK